MPGSTVVPGSTAAQLTEDGEETFSGLSNHEDSTPGHHCADVCMDARPPV